MSLKKWIFIISLLLILNLLFFVFLSNSNLKNTPKNIGEYQKVRMILTTSGTKTGINTLVANKLAEIVAEESGGNVIIEVYPNDQLAGGNTTKGIHMLADGSVDMAVYTSGTFSTLDPQISVATLPWTFKSYQEARQVINDTGGAYYAKALAKQGLIYLGSTHNGMRQISNNAHPIHTLEDMKGLKIRILANDVSRQFFLTLGAIPIAMSRSEMFTALREGNIDGHDMGIYQSGADNFNEIEKYITILNYSYENYIFVVNSKIFDRLEPKTQEFLKQKTKEACDWGNDFLENNEQNIKRQFIYKDVDIIELAPDELQKFKEQINPLIEQLKEKYDDEACAAFGIR